MPSSPENQRYVDASSGQSTEYAKQVADAVQTELASLQESIKNAIPVRDTLNFAEHEVVAGESVTQIIMNLCEAASYSNRDLLLLSYGFMFKQAAIINAEINTIHPGDKLKLENGKLTITRAAGSTLQSFSVDIYPWAGGNAPALVGAAPAAASAPVAPAPAPAGTPPDTPPAPGLGGPAGGGTPTPDTPPPAGLGGSGASEPVGPPTPGLGAPSPAGGSETPPPAGLGGSGTSEPVGPPTPGL